MQSTRPNTFAEGLPATPPEAASQRPELSVPPDAEVLQGLTEASHDMIFIVDPRGLVMYANPTLTRQFSTEPERFLGRPLLALLPAKAPEQTQADLEKVLASGQPAYQETSVLFPHGERWLGTWLLPLRNAEGRVTAVLGTARDLTVRRRTEAALRESEERYRRLVELAPYGVFVHCHGKIVFANSTGLDLLGARRQEELLGRSFLEFIPPHQLSAAQQRVRQVIELGARTPFLETQFVRLDGGVLDVEEMSIPFELDNEPAVQVIARDITETRRLDRALQQSEARFERIFRAGPAVVGISTVEEGRFVEVNENFLQVTGFSREEVIGKTGAELGLWVQPERREELFRLVREQGQVRNFEADLFSKDRQVRHILLSVETLQLAAGPCMLFSALDVTDRRQLEERLREAQKLEAIGQLARGVAHDFNNILTIIQGHTTLIRMQNEVSPRVADSLRQVSEAAERAANLTRQLLTFSRRQPLQPRVLDLNQVLGSLTEMLRRALGEDIVLEVKPAPALSPVMADLGMMEQVLLNLTINARDAMPRGGRLILSTASRTYAADEPGLPRGLVAGPYVCLTVQDTGEGIAPEVLPRIFEPFFTTKEPGKGSGLGLATVHSIVQQHQGWIEVNSEPKQGTTFRMFLPVVPTLAPAAGPEARSLVMPMGRETVLLVEDEDEVRRLYRDVLEQCGYKVLTAANGPEALRVWQRRGEQVDLLLTDVVMPGGLNGRELAQRFAAEKPGLKVILTTGYRFDLGGKGGPLVFQWRLLQKPYPPESLAQVVRECLDMR
jgi:PAS domain S-box-containing protein